jgi:hypothetical protein
MGAVAEAEGAGGALETEGPGAVVAAAGTVLAAVGVGPALEATGAGTLIVGAATDREGVGAAELIASGTLAVDSGDVLAESFASGALQEQAAALTKKETELRRSRGLDCLMAMVVPGITELRSWGGVE